jgi:UDP-hydrolysing UDP-N-acetyl-D-glucosamine 2-epimerase
MKRKVCVVITARPSYSRIKTALNAIKNHAELELQLVVTASALLDRYGCAVSVIEKDGFQIAARAFTVLEGEDLTSMAKTTGIGIMELSTIFANIKPDMVVSIADRYETMATAIAASYMNIPLVHIQGGEVTGNIDEKVRHAISKLSDLHLVSNDSSRQRLIKMGEEAEAVHITGCPSIDLAAEVLNSNDKFDFDPFELYGGVGSTIDISRGYLVVMQHPVTTEYSLARKQVEETLNAIKDIDIPTMWFWPNVDAGADGTSKGIRAFRERESPRNIHFFKNMEPRHFLKLLVNSKAIIGNSSVAIRECSYLGVPAINIGLRQSGRDRGTNVIDAPHDRKAIRAAINAQLEHKRNLGQDFLYGDGFAGERIAQILAKVRIDIKKRITY